MVLSEHATGVSGGLFCSVLGPLVFNNVWRYTYFQLLDDMKSKLSGWLSDSSKTFFPWHYKSSQIYLNGNVSLTQLVMKNVIHCKQLSCHCKCKRSDL